MQRHWSWLVSLLLLPVLLARATPAADLREMQWILEGVTRTALVYVPATARTHPTPLVFVFHGHGGTSRSAANSFALDRNWPEAISVYMQGLNTPGQLTDPEGHRPGWQAALGDQGDRDLKFFDAVLARLQQDYRVDPKRVYATGHSNGGGFCFLLWLARGDLLAAVAPSSAVAKYARQLKPKPVMHLAGEHDSLVKFAWQQQMMDSERKINGCRATGEPWGSRCTLYPSSHGTPVATFIHSGGHVLDPAAPPLIVKFFKQFPTAHAD